ncbi:MAG: DnaJ C-terminal domain-containing protein, partial [Tepidisphaeraceae bacterium]
VTKTASADDIRKAHRKLVRQYHPDVNKNSPAATEKFKEVQEAYDVLSDKEKRRMYDQYGEAGVGAGVHAGPDPFGGGRRPGRGGSYQWRSEPGVTVEDLDPSDFGNGQFSEIFEQLFGGRAGPTQFRRGRAETPRGADVEYPVTLNFKDAARGTSLSIKVNRGGKLETIDVKIPPGVKDGSRIRIKGQGEHSAGGHGDLFIVTSVRPHDYFRREGLDIVLDLPVSLYEAILGTKVAVPTLDGPVTLTVPPGTSSHSKLRIKSRGVFRGDEKGDQLCVVKVIVPRDLAPDDLRNIEKLAKTHPIDARQDAGW